MSLESLGRFGEDIGVEKGPGTFDSLKAAVLKKLETRGPWARIADDVTKTAERYTQA